MSAPGNQTMVNDLKSFYLTNPTSELDLEDASGNIVALTASGNTLLVNGTPITNEPVSNWSLYPTLSNQIFMDPSNILSNIGGDLYFNNQLLALAGQISNVADWYLYPALSNVNFNNNDANAIGNLVVISNSTIASCIGQGFGLLNYSLTQNQGDFILWSPVADLSNGNRPNATFEADNFRIGFTGKTLSGTTWYNQDNTPFEVVDQNTQAPISSAQPNFEIFARNMMITTPAFTMTNTTEAVITGDTRQGQILSSNIFPFPGATYTTAQIGGNLQIGTLSNGQLFPYPTARFAVDEFKVGNFIGEPGGENAPAVNVNARSMALGSIGSTANASVNGIAVSINGTATAGITSPVTTLTGGIVNITGAGGVAVTSPGGVAVTGGTLALDSPIGCTITGGGGVAITGGLGVSITGGAGVSVTGGGSVSLTGGGGISVNDLGGATFRGGNVLLTLGADQTIDNGTLTLSGTSSGIYAGSIRPNNTNALQIGDFGNTTTNPISLSNINSIQAFGAGGQIINMSLDLSGNNITNGGSITANAQVYTPQIITTDPNPSLYLVLKGGQGIEVRDAASALGAVACRSVNLEDALNQVIALTNDASNVYANGNALAYASALSNWAQYPAVQNVDLSQNAIVGVQNLDFTNLTNNPALKNSTPSQGIEVVSEQGLFVKNVNTGSREKIDAKTFVGDNIFLDGTTTPPSLHMNAGNDTFLYRISGDQQGTQRITSTLATNGGFLLDSDINPPVFNLSGSTLELKAKDPTTDPTGVTLKTLTSANLAGLSFFRGGQYYKTAIQNTTSATPNVDITFDASAPYTDVAAITHPNATDFVVQVAGTYSLEFKVTFIANTSTWNTTTNRISCAMDIARSPTPEQVVLNTTALQPSPQNWAMTTTGVVELQVGDVINCRVTNTLAAGGTGYYQAVQNTYDYNTTFSWSLLNATSPSVPAQASFSSTATQLVSAADTPTIIAHNTTDFNGGGFSLSGGDIVVASAGTYQVDCSIQLDKSGGGVSPCDFWFRVGGVDVPNSASQVVVAGTNGETLANAPMLLTFTAGQALSVVIASSDNTMAATAFAAQTSPYARPAIPSIITRIQRVA